MTCSYLHPYYISGTDFKGNDAPALSTELGPLNEKHQRFVAALNWYPVAIFFVVTVISTDAHKKIVMLWRVP